MKKGRYTYHEKTYHPKFGELEPGKTYELPDDWDFIKESLFERVEEVASATEKPRSNKK